MNSHHQAGDLTIRSQILRQLLCWHSCDMFTTALTSQEMASISFQYSVPISSSTQMTKTKPKRIYCGQAICLFFDSLISSMTVKAELWWHGSQAQSPVYQDILEESKFKARIWAGIYLSVQSSIQNLFFFLLLLSWAPRKPGIRVIITCNSNTQKMEARGWGGQGHGKFVTL